MKRAIRFDRGETLAARSKQADIFDTGVQRRADSTRRPGLPIGPSLYRARASLEKLIAEARAARTMPWAPSQLSLYRLIFQQMTLWLPLDEAAQYRFTFDAELKRLEPA